MSIRSLEIHGMNCANCALRVERTLSALPGVTSARVALASERAVVEGEASMDALVDAVNALGYKARPAEAHSIHERIEARRERRRADARYWRRQCLLSLFVAPVVLMAMLPHFGVALEHHLLWQFVLATIALVFIAPPFYRPGLRDLVHFRFEMNALVTLGTILAYTSSVYELATGGGHVYFEDAVAILAALSIGRFLEANGKARAAAAVEGLIDLEAPTTRLLRDGREVEVETAAVLPGDDVIVRPGEKVTVDGIVVDGRADADESLLTGESVPVPKEPGARVIAGSLIHGGMLRVRAERTGEETSLSGILREMEQVSSSRTRYQDFADRVVSIFMPTVLAVAVVTLFGWFLRTGDLVASLRPAIAVLIIACPCALGIAMPVAIAVGAGVAARRGILIRDAAVLDRIPHLRVFVFDKTGTVTTGKLRLAAMRCVGIEDERVLELVARVEVMSEHAVGAAIASGWRERSGAHEITHAANFRSEPGRGVSGDCDEWAVRVGRVEWSGAQPDAADEEWIKAESEAGRIVFSAHLASREGNRDARAFFSLADTARPEAADIVAALRREGFHTVLLSGDRPAAVGSLARRLGFDAFRAGVLPAEKAAVLRELRAQFSAPVAMVGDGVNDAPALAEADLGVAMSEGSGLAVEAGAVTLTRSDLRALPELLQLGRAVSRKARENLFWAFFYNVILIPAAAFGYASPIFAALAMAVSDLTVILNALRLWRRLPRTGPA